MNFAGLEIPLVQFSPGVVAAVFLAVLLIFATFTAVMMYHWRAYGIGPLDSRPARIYLSVAGIFILVMTLAGLTLSFSS